MAIMIPSGVTNSVISSAEKKIFSWFQNAAGTDNWYVLHSLGLASHRTVIRGETDFLVLAPNLGIFALEVKGGEVKRLADGRWQFTDRNGQTGIRNRGPFDQANEGIHSIIAYIKQHLDSDHQHLQYVLFGSGVMFPDITYNSNGIDEDQKQIFDYRDSHKVRGFVERLSAYAQQRWQEIYHFSAATKLPDANDVKYIAAMLRGQFECVVSMNAEIAGTEREQLQLTKCQYDCLDGLEDNARCLITGYAGTGKTMVAAEAVKRFAQAGERVALFCYNAGLSDWLCEYCSRWEKPVAYVGSVHRFMMSMTGLKPGIHDTLSEFYHIRLPKATLSLLPDIDFDKFDRIIIDEAQDLISDSYLGVFDLLLKKGLCRGKWIMFGDLTMQAIYTNQSVDDMLDCLERYSPFFVRYSLKQNCRNTKQICKGIKMVTGLLLDWHQNKMAEGREVDWQTWRNDEEQYEKLVTIITRLTDDGVDPGKITVLSPVRRANSVVRMLSGMKVRNYDASMHHDLTFSTVQGFKGLENSVIILTDIRNLRDEKLLYVAMSRARNSLHILVEEGEYNRELIRLYERMTGNE